jgi:hypothetical protein
MLLAKEIGKLQTGAKVDAAWAFQCLATIAEDAFGEIGFDLANEGCESVVDSVIGLVKDQLKLVQAKEAARQGAAF